MKFMVVDDSKIIRGKITKILQEDQAHDITIVGAAQNGIEAVELCKKTMPDLATMDLTMPHMDGVETIGKLVELNPNILILVVSALADKATAIEALKRGAHGFLCKPFSDEELTSAISELVQAGEEL